MPRIVPSSIGRKSKNSVRSVSVASESILPLFLMGSFSWIHCRFVVFPQSPAP